MAKSQMVINYVPGEECRVAVVYDGKLHELHAERMDNASHVGNVYVGRVVNVEAAIQAAFVDFGLEHNGFLHVSDLHPQYFPDADDETTERVGKKTPRRDRPPIQACLRRGDEVAVQVLKEGVGTKGPTVTSYLSIPGRFLVMMPQMDRVGVSRKVEDEDTRRKMREILDQLDLPEGFGFILRTAGMDRGKMELKRDLAYLLRLWKDMEKRWKSGNKPRLLYSESDLLVRALRDILSTDIEEVVVDNEAALNRAGRFLKIVAPRSTTKLIHYKGHAPIFHVMGLEEQIQMIHAREVPLPSGGRLVIDETEALVAIDVNSGKSREARDAETNAFRTNMEAAEEICRQLRLRDLGGVIVNDLIDMRFSKHRREVENKFKDLLKKDRARWTTAPISEFGILEMTRQRMRGSHESQHFADCPTCRGRGLIQRPDSLATESLRELSAMLDNDRVHRMEMVVHPRIAGSLLSTKRRALSRIERTSGKHVDVRVSEAIPVDRVTYYAYDDRGADLDVAKLGPRKARPEELVEYELPRAAAHDDWAAEAPAPEPEPIDEPQEAAAELEPHPIELDHDDLDVEAPSPAPGRSEESGGRRGRRRRGRRGRGRGAEPAAAAPAAPAAPAAESEEPDVEAPTSEDELGSDRPFSERRSRPADGAAAEQGGEGGGRKRRRRRRRGRGGRGPDGAAPAAPSDTGEFASSDGGGLEVGASDEAEPDTSEQPEGDEAPTGTEAPAGEGGQRKRRRRRRRGRGGRGAEGAPVSANGTAAHAMSESADDEHHEQPEASDEGGEPESADSDAAAHADEPSMRDGPTGPAGEGEGGRRRRRRRRRGRGGSGGGGQSGGESGGQAPASQPPRAQTPSPAPASAPSSSGSDKKASGGSRPRVLYSSRRKLGPGEKRGLGGADE